MAPERSPKRQKTSQVSTTSLLTSEPSQIPLPPDTSRGSNANSPQAQQSSWYASWSRKAPPITQVVRESIQSAGNVASEITSKVPTSPKIRAVRTPSLAMTLGKKQSNRALPADATTTVVHATSEASPSRKTSSKPEGRAATDTKAPPQVDNAEPTLSTEIKVSDTSKQSDKAEATKEMDQQISTEANQGLRSSWLGWLGKADVAQSQDSGTSTAQSNEQEQHEQSLSSQSEQPAAALSEVSQMTKAVPTPAGETNTQQKGKTTRKSWLPWIGDEFIEPDSVLSTPNSHLDGNNSNQPSKEIAKNNVRQDTPVQSKVPPSSPPDLPHDEAKPSGWAFWGRDRNVTESSTSVNKPHEGEIAISGTPSQTKPRRTSISLQKPNAVSDSSKPDTKNADSAIVAPPKNETSQSAAKLQNADDRTGNSATVKQKKKGDLVTSKVDSTNATASAVAPVENNKPVSIRSARTYHNLLLPEFHSTLKLPESPSIVEQLARLFRINKEPELHHLSLIKDPPRIKNALAIGVHGFFPAPLLRTVLGQPTGTSIKFADMAAKSIRRWTTARGYDCTVKTAALEGEGKIAERIELLWKLLLNWIDEIRKSDFVLVACHSQGVPVAIMLVAKLMEFGCVSSSKVGICAMAGVNMGPFPEYKSRWISGSAGELFEFSIPNSRVSTDYLAALEIVLKYGVRVTFVGSIDDQLVSLESSIFSPVSHPHIYRAVQIDAKVHAPNFLSHLVSFALKLRNLGVQDHGLIRELSPPLAGSLYTGEGHSRIYEDDAVYDLAVSFALETNSMTNLPLSQSSVSMLGAGGNTNPYILPFAMRGILEEDFVKNELSGEASELLRQFDEWKPTTKVLKDVKFRLEGIRSKL